MEILIFRHHFKTHSYPLENVSRHRDSKFMWVKPLWQSKHIYMSYFHVQIYIHIRLTMKGLKELKFRLLYKPILYIYTV